MARKRLALTGGSYATRSLTIAAQRALNLYPEPIPQVENEPVTVYSVPTPGLQPYLTPPNGSVIRGLYTASDNLLYVVCGAYIYRYAPPTWTALFGPIGTSAGPVSMVDNGTELLIVDGSTTYYIHNLSTGVNTIAVLPSSNGSSHIAYVDTYFIVNDVATPDFYVSDSQSSTFNALNFGAVASRSGYIQGVATVHRNLWLITNNCAEVWYNSGGADFPFALSAGVFNDAGCVAKYTIAQTQDTIFWMGKSQNGSLRVFAGSGTSVQPISTYAIDATLTGYSINDTSQVLDDCTGWCYEQGGHSFYVLNIPAPFDQTWVYDLSTGLWHERAYTPDASTEHRHRGNCAASFAGKIVVGDWEDNNIWFLDPNAGNDNGATQKRIRTFYHSEAAGGERVMYSMFQAQMSAGGEVDATVDLDWSDDGGQTWGSPVSQTLSVTGNTLTTPTWWRLGYARSRVFRLTWQADVDAVLSSAVVDFERAGS